jgi:hypothetical protein
VDKIVSILELFGKKFVDDVRQSAKDKGMTYGGGDSRLSASMDYKVTKGEDVITMVFFMAEYGYIRDVGRGKLGDPAKPPRSKKAGGVSQEGQAKITEWVKRKKYVKSFQESTLKARVEIQNKSKEKNKKRKQWKTLKQISFEKAAIQLGTIISLRIAKEGYKGNHFYTDVVNKIDTGKLSKQISEILKTDILIEIKK